ncbi:MAG: hypothetical protein GXP63_03305 [DPANN group archaeon]|nr:hypothetical protein [DPANN group archaeon]
MLTVLSGAFAFTPVVGSDIGITIETEDFAPLIWLHQDGCKVYHNAADGGQELVERVENYAFEGEQIKCPVLVMDKNGIEKVKDIYGGLSVPPGQDSGDFDIQVNCDEHGDQFDTDPDNYNARIGEERINTYDPNDMRVYMCTFTVETPQSMYGEYFLSFVVEDLDGLTGSVDENQYFFLNPAVAVTVIGDVNFGTVRPGTNSYSDTLLIQNSADDGSGVLLNMAISGTDFYDPTSSGAKCPTSNVLGLENFAYYATNGAHKTNTNVAGRTNTVGQDGDDEGYFNIPYEVADPDARAPIIEKDGKIKLNGKEFWAGNVLSPGAEIALTFRLALPEPCNGDFNDGSLYFWGTAI